MSTALLIILALLIYFASYWVYGKRISKNLVKVDDSRKTPAVEINDGVDYVPTNKWVLFGHHFASIAGAAPIIGPAIAIAWGWIPAILWIWFGNVFIGMVHDYLSLMASVRKKGKSIAWIAGELTNKGTGYLFSWFIFLTLILIVAAFGAVMGIIFVKEPASRHSYRPGAHSLIHLDRSFISYTCIFSYMDDSYPNLHYCGSRSTGLDSYAAKRLFEFIYIIFWSCCRWAIFTNYRLYR